MQTILHLQSQFQYNHAYASLLHSYVLGNNDNLKMLVQIFSQSFFEGLWLSKWDFTLLDPSIITDSLGAINLFFSLHILEFNTGNLPEKVIWLLIYIKTLIIWPLLLFETIILKVEKKNKLPRIYIFNFIFLPFTFVSDK